MRISTSPADAEPVTCEKCGATTQLYTGVCASCLLREGLEAWRRGLESSF